MARQKHNRRYYLHDIPLDEASQRFHNALQEIGSLIQSLPETIPIDQALSRVTAKPVWAKISSPHYDSAAMDGVAVRSSDTLGATETSPLRLKIGSQALWVDTGDPMPSKFDAVIMLEVLHEVDESTIEIQSPVAPYQHVRPLGEDIVATELILPENHQIRPVDLGACASAGLTELVVRQCPTVAIVPTGTELVSPGDSLDPGAILESNSLVLAGMVDEWGGQARRWPIVPDEYDQLRTTLKKATLQSDIVIVNAGSSAGSQDYTARLVEETGQLLVHGVAIKPGHPVVLGIVNDKPVLGIPGYPVSAMLTCELFVKPLIEINLGIRPRIRQSITATITRKVLSSMGEDEFIRVRLGRVAKKMVATPIQRGAGAIMSMVQADGLVLVPRFTEGLDTGQDVTVELLRPMEDINGTIVTIGSHDLTLDLLASQIHRQNPSLSLSSSNVGSLGGLMALSRDEAHLAGIHLLDEESGQYNIPFVHRYLSGRDVVLVNLVHRVQGLIVPKGNPKSFSSLKQLTNSNTIFINRQRGSGTRLLLDYKLKQLGIPSDKIRGYDREEYTHLAVAAAVKANKADVGLGILSAAKAIGLDFVPLFNESYDLVIPKEFYESDLLQPLLTLISSQEFRQDVEALGGYDTRTMAKIVAQISSGRS